MQKRQDKIAVIGGGLIGRSWAMIFLSEGYHVQMYDVTSSLVERSLEEIQKQLIELESSGNLRGRGSASEQYELLSGFTDLKACVKDVIYIQECVPEDLQLKKKIHKQLDNLTESHVILSSSTSAIPCSKISEGLVNRHRCIVAHPVNPPYYVPLVEVVPAPWTCEEVISRTRELLVSLGQTPIVLRKELRGFLQPRLQITIIMECLKLLREGVLDVEEVDKLLKDGLGLIYTFVGPLELLHLSHEQGFKGFLEDNLIEIQAVCDSLESPVQLSASNPLMQSIAGSLFEVNSPGEGLARARHWRDTRLAALASFIRRYRHSMQ